MDAHSSESYGTVLGGPTPSKPVDPTLSVKEMYGSLEDSNNSSTRSKRPKENETKPQSSAKPHHSNNSNNNHHKVNDDFDDDDEEDEGEDGYKKGGYHRVHIGDVYQERYQVIEKLGWGHFSTVWLCQDLKGGPKVALKIVKSARHYTEAAEDEIDILRKLRSLDPSGQRCTVALLDDFDIRGPHGKHICMAFEVLGSNLLDLIKHYNYQGIPVPIVKSICKQILIGLDFMHAECLVIHTDLKPENVLLHYKLPKRSSKKSNTNSNTNTTSTIDHSATTTTDGMPPQSPPHEMIPRDIDVNDPSTYQVRIADFGNACWTFKHFTSDIQTRQYRAPEVILGSKYDCSVDMWSFGCMVFELATGDLLFEPKNGKKFDKNDGQMMELLGRMPKRAMTGKYMRDFFNRKGELKYIKRLKFWSLTEVLQEKYHWKANEADELASFILPCLRWHPSQRATAKEMLQHPFIN